MPLAMPAVGRRAVHTRAIECSSFARDDGLWDIEGHLTDVKTYAFANAHRGEIKAGEPVHDIWIRLTVDADFVIHEAKLIPEAGQIFMFHGFRFEVIRRQRNQITAIRITPPSALRPDAAAE